MDINLKIPAFEKLLDFVASGIGSIAGPMLEPWKAKQKVKAKRITAEGEKRILIIQAEAQSEARKILLSEDAEISGELTVTNMIDQRIQFQEKKRQSNLQSVVYKAAHQLKDKIVSDGEPDHDWTARFFNEVQDVSTEEMQKLWAKVLAGEVEQAGSTSIRTLGILKNLDQETASLFSRFCSACVFVFHNQNENHFEIDDARIPSLGGNPGDNCLREYGFAYGLLNILNEHGLIISDYNSWRDYQSAVGLVVRDSSAVLRFPFVFQNRYWVLVPTDHYSSEQFKLHGVALTEAGKELSRVVGLEPMEKFTQDLKKFFSKKKLKMTEVDDWSPNTFEQIAND